MSEPVIESVVPGAGVEGGGRQVLICGRAVVDDRLRGKDIHESTFHHLSRLLWNHFVVGLQ